MSKFQKASKILEVGFALSNWTHFHRTYLVTACKQKLLAVYQSDTLPLFASIFIPVDKEWFRKEDEILIYTIKLQPLSVKKALDVCPTCQ